MKQADVQALSTRPARDKKCVLSVYLNVDPSQPKNLNRGFEAQFKKLAASLRTFLKVRPKSDGLDAAIRRAKDFVATYTPKGRGLALFVDESDGFFSHKELNVPVTNQIRWDHELFLQPLTNSIDELDDYGVVRLDRTKLAESQTPGFECTECFALFSVKRSTCVFCNAPVQPVSNVFEQALGNAFRSEATMEVLTGKAAAALNSAGSTGAFPKTRTNAAVAE